MSTTSIGSSLPSHAAPARQYATSDPCLHFATVELCRKRGMLDRDAAFNPGNDGYCPLSESRFSNALVPTAIAGAVEVRMQLRVRRWGGTSANLEAVEAFVADRGAPATTTRACARFQTPATLHLFHSVTGGHPSLSPQWRMAREPTAHAPSSVGSHFSSLRPACAWPEACEGSTASLTASRQRREAPGLCRSSGTGRACCTEAGCTPR